MAVSTDSSIPHTVQDYIVLPLTCPAQPSYPHTTTHYLYLRHNAPKMVTSDTPREVFLVNVPVDATTANIKSLFADQLDGAARVERIEFENISSKHTKASSTTAALTASSSSSSGSRKRKRVNPVGHDPSATAAVPLPDLWDRTLHTTGCTAIATFVDGPSAELALRSAAKASRSRRKVLWASNTPSSSSSSTSRPRELGSTRYLTHQALRYPDTHTLQTNTDAYMHAFEAAEVNRRRRLARLRSQPDEDGFVTVTRGGRAAPAFEASNAQALEKQLVRQKAARPDDFYRFQHREKLKEQANELIRGFEDDRRKVDEMKRRRTNFVPRAT